MRSPSGGCLHGRRDHPGHPGRHGPRDRHGHDRRRSGTVVTLAALTAAAVVTVALLLHDGRAVLVLVHLDGERAQDVLVEAHLTLHLLHGGGRCLDVHQREVRLAVLVDAVAEGLEPPVFGTADGAATFGEHGLVLLDEFVDSLTGHVLADQEHGLV